MISIFQTILLRLCDKNIVLEVIEGTALTITVTDKEITVSHNATSSAYNTALLKEHMIDFLPKKQVNE